MTIDPTQRPPTPPPQQTMKPICKCQKCGVADNLLYLKTINDNNSLVISCSGYPECRHSIWLPMDIIREAIVTDTACQRCGTDTMKICLTFRRMQQMCLLNSAYMDGLNYTSCIICDNSLRDLLDINNRQSAPSSNVTRTNVQQRNTSTTIARPVSNNQQNSENIAARSIMPPPARRPPPPPTGSNNRTNSRPPFNPNPGNLPVPRNFDRPPRRPPGDDGSGGGGGGGGVNCTKCGLPAQKLTVRKEGPNTGREFYKCNNAACNFFQWADAAAVAPSGAGGYNQNNGDGGYNGRPAGNNSINRGAGSSYPSSSRGNRGGGRNNSDGSADSRKRKCGLCRQEGHTRIKCPRRNHDND